LNASDDDVKNWIRIFTLLSKTEIEGLEVEHAAAPHLRALQKALAKDITIRVHGETAYNTAVEASTILFGASTSDALNSLDEATFLDVFEGVQQSKISISELEAGINIVELLSDKTQIFPSRGEARKMIVGGGTYLNKQKYTDPESTVDESLLINGKYIIAQKGKKNHYLIIAE
jgi:tyrosyl-tRNA synthetase